MPSMKLLAKTFHHYLLPVAEHVVLSPEKLLQIAHTPVSIDKGE